MKKIKVKNVKIGFFVKSGYKPGYAYIKKININNKSKRIWLWGYWCESIKEAKKGLDMDFLPTSDGGKISYWDLTSERYVLAREPTKEELKKIIVDEL